MMPFSFFDQITRMDRERERELLKYTSVVAL